MTAFSVVFAALAITFVPASVLAASDDGIITDLAAVTDLKNTIDTVWVLFCAFLVFWMNAGFALLESGFCREKNAVNILSKNFVVFALTTVSFYFVGFAFMFGNGNDYFGLQGWLVGTDEKAFSSLSWTSVPLSAKFFFQLVFAGTAATIISGAVAERIRYSAFLIFSLVMGAFIYPIGGHWIWGGGTLAKNGMLDFAGSTVVHSVGGWCALAGILILGPRRGKYADDGTPMPILGHNMTSATLGTFILWLGWFGFNGGSTMSANPNAISHVVVVTNLAAAIGATVSTAYTWLRVGKPDLGLTCNGCLAGLVSITASCAYVSSHSALVIGGIAGVLVVEGVLMFDRLRIDDPVGALSVHLVCGVFGTLCLGLFGDLEIAKSIGGVDLKSAGLLLGGGAGQLLEQARGATVIGLFTFLASSAVWWVMSQTIGLRVSEEAELVGLDLTEMGMEAYPKELPVSPLAARNPPVIVAPQPALSRRT
jgi:Amt family ammonium transporter